MRELYQGNLYDDPFIPGNYLEYKEITGLTDYLTPTELIWARYLAFHVGLPNYTTKLEHIYDEYRGLRVKPTNAVLNQHFSNILKKIAPPKLQQVVYRDFETNPTKVGLWFRHVCIEIFREDNLEGALNVNSKPTLEDYDFEES